ncbi:MAG: hypothetical protein QF831_05540 [Candidatus Thalassarchaeaceae archaeon]|nr:hypothetical protein [Candidatus Thalassarchaeaceae archaeon]
MPLVDDDIDEATPWFSNRMMKAYEATNRGLIVNIAEDSTPYFFTQVSEFELWMGEVEKTIGIPLGRKLAHSAAESEEYRLLGNLSDMPNPLFNKMKKRMEWVNQSWELRGLGQLELMKKEEKSTKLIVHNRAHSAFAAGMASATYEILTGTRYRFHWTDDGNSESLITLERDMRPIPPAERVEGKWTDAEGDNVREEGMHPLARAYHESSGTWSNDSIRMMAIRQDHLLRFEESIMPQLFETEISDSGRFIWEGISDSERINTWTGFAEASRTRFTAGEEMILVADAEHWIHVGRRFLGKFGLGGIDSAVAIDEQGGVKLHLSSLFHPAIVAGILAAAWERAEARYAKCEWSCSQNGHIIQISSLHELA